MYSQFPINLTPEDRYLVELYAKRNGITMAEAIRVAIRKTFKKKVRQRPANGGK